MSRYHYTPLFLFILLISLFIYSIPTGAAPTWAAGSGSALLEYGRLHPRAGAERQQFPPPRPAEPDKAITDLDPRQPQATGDATCGGAWQATLRFDDLYAVAYGAGLYVAAGVDGTILTSPDGVTWTRRASGVSYTFLGVTSGGDQFVVVGFQYGSSGTILTSPDGVTWTPRVSGGTYYLGGVTWGGNQFVAVGASGAILTSPNGLTWTPRASGGASSLYGVTWGGNQFVAVGWGGAILTSPDGVTWTPRASGAPPPWWRDWGGNQFVAVGLEGTILTSPDGVTWTPRASGVTSFLLGVTWGGDQFVAVGGRRDPDQPGRGDLDPARLGQHLLALRA